MPMRREVPCSCPLVCVDSIPGMREADGDCIQQVDESVASRWALTRFAVEPSVTTTNQKRLSRSTIRRRRESDCLKSIQILAHVATTMTPWKPRILRWNPIKLERRNITHQSVDAQQAHKLVQPLLFVASARSACPEGQKRWQRIRLHLYDREKLDGNASSKEHAERDRRRSCCQHSFQYLPSQLATHNSGIDTFLLLSNSAYSR